MSDKVKLTILNFRDFQPRKDLKSLSWIRIDANIFDDENLHEKIGTEGMMLFIYLLIRAAKKNSPDVEFSLSFLEKKLNIKIAKIKSTIQILEQNQIVHGFVFDPYKLVHYTTLHNITDITNITDTTGSICDLKSPPPSAENLHPLFLLWNSAATKFSKIKKSSPKRDKKIEALWKQNSEDEWLAIITRLNDSDFCTGKNDRGWKATFDWLLQEETHLKISEGKYDNRSKPSTKRFANERDHDQVVDEFNTIASGIDPNTGKPLG